MPTVSYAQNGEDIVLRRVFPPGHRGFYIDVGANNPLEDTVTRYFYEQGWDGINIEPGDIFSQVAAHRPRDVNLNVGVSNVTGVQKFYDFPDYPGSSTYCEHQATIHRRDHGFRCIERSVPIATLKAICDLHVRRPIDFISIDVEGLERQVLEGADWDRYRPVVVVIEATRPNTGIPSHRDWEDILWQAQYRFALFDGLNRYYVRAEDAHLLSALSAPASCIDDYVPYRHLRMVQELQSRLALIEGVGPRSLAIARQINLVAKRVRKVTWRLKHLVRRAA
jgi:FkbM family methyltransferase